MSLTLKPYQSHALRPGDLPRAVVTGLYVHIPFCFHKCHYCDFYSITRQTPERMDRFVDLILREAELWTTGPTLAAKTIFFGGGTPTLLPAEMMRRLIRGLRVRFDLSACDEWTIEANPATVTLEYCQMLREEGIGRLSFGAQSFDPRELAILERHHNPDDVPRSLELARQAGFSRLNVDLIYAIPGQTNAAWLKSLHAALALNTPHISCYGLTFEPNTPIAVKRRLGQLNSVDESIELEMLSQTRQILTASGRPPYEISNYAIPGQECRHNLLYWSGGDYLSLGPSAASHVQGWRWRNRPHLGEWENAIEQNLLPAIELETLTPLHRAGELAMLSLRLSRGLIFSEFTARSGYDARALFADAISQLRKPGLIAMDDYRITLTPSGIPVADAIAAKFLAPTLEPLNS